MPSTLPTLQVTVPEPHWSQCPPRARHHACCPPHATPGAHPVSPWAPTLWCPPTSPTAQTRPVLEPTPHHQRPPTPCPSRCPLTLQPWEEMMRMSAGTRSPPFTSTRSPTTTFSALIWIFSPSRITSACCRGAGHPERCLGTPTPPGTPTPSRAPAQGAYLGHHVLEGVHDLGALGLLVVGEAAGDDDDGGQHHPQVQLGPRQRLSTRPPAPGCRVGPPGAPQHRARGRGPPRQPGPFATRTPQELAHSSGGVAPVPSPPPSPPSAGTPPGCPCPCSVGAPCDAHAPP